MFNMKKVEIEWGGKTLTLETGRVARQADGAVLATYGETVVLCAVTAAKSVKEGQDFFPLTISGVPFMGPIAAARIGYQDGEYQLNPSMDQVREGQLDLVVAGTHDAVMMVESEAKELSEEVMLGAVMFAHRECQKVIEAIIKLAEKAAKDPWDMAEQADLTAAKKKLKDLIGKDIAATYKLTDKSQRSSALNEARAKAKAAFADATPQDQMAAQKLMKKLEAEIVRTAI